VQRRSVALSGNAVDLAQRDGLDAAIAQEPFRSR